MKCISDNQWKLMVSFKDSWFYTHTAHLSSEICSFIRCYIEKKLSYHLTLLGIHCETTDLKVFLNNMDKFNKEADIKESHIKFRRCTEMSITGEPNISYSALYENNPSMESFQNLRAKSSLKIYHTIWFTKINSSMNIEWWCQDVQVQQVQEEGLLGMLLLEEISWRNTNVRPTHARRHAPDKYYMSYAHIVHVYSLVSIDKLVRRLKKFVTCLYICQANLWNDSLNVIIFHDGKVFTRRMPYMNTLRYHWQKICRDGKMFLYVKFIAIIYTKE